MSGLIQLVSLVFIQFSVSVNLCLSDPNRAVQRCAAAVGLLPSGCAVCAPFLPAVPNRAAAGSEGWNRMVRKRKT